jgi:hypothetical protein
MATRIEARSQPSRPLNIYEQAAIKVVSDWTAAWQAKDPDKMAEASAANLRDPGTVDLPNTIADQAPEFTGQSSTSFAAEIPDCG